jgi:hypothetical protein
MNYLVFDQEGELLDVLTFNSNDDLTLFKSTNPTYVIREEEDFIIDEDDFFTEDDEGFEW